MSAVTQLKEQLHHLSMESKQAAGGLGGFQNRFGQSSAQVQALIAEFYYGGTPIAMGTGSAITVEQACAAAAEFLTTGQRPEVVAWTVAED